MNRKHLKEKQNPDWLHRQSGAYYLMSKCYPTNYETPPSLVSCNNKRKLW